LSTIVFMEFLMGFFQNNEHSEADAFTNKTILQYDLIPIDYRIAKKAARIRAQYGIRLRDALIAATTILSECDYFISKNKPFLKKLDIQKISPKEFVEKLLNNS